MKSASSCAALLLGLLAPGLVSAEASPLSARLACAPEAGPGRVFCQLDLSASEGRLVWGDALVSEAPDFARPLRSRVAARPDDNGTSTWVAKLALVATRAGSGTLAVSARAVVCRTIAAHEECTPERVELRAPVVVSAGSSEN